jgi:hypothetical protein
MIRFPPSIFFSTAKSASLNGVSGKAAAEKPACV